MSPSKSEDLNSIRSYYDYNTPRFLSYGKQIRTRTIHRPVWGDGIVSEEQALHYVHELILGEARDILKTHSTEIRVLDLGCGVGASLFYLANHLGKNFSGVGITISPVQAKLALADRDLQNQINDCEFIVGDFQIPPIRDKFDIIFSIESFAHSSTPLEYFQGISRLLKLGGRLIICDDFLSGNSLARSMKSRNKSWLDIYRWGWGVTNILPPEQVEDLAASVKLNRIRNLDLTLYLRLQPIPVFLFEFISRSIKFLANKNLYLRSVIGGQALQLCLAHGVVDYRYMVFEGVS